MEETRDFYLERDFIKKKVLNPDCAFTDCNTAPLSIRQTGV